MTTTAPATPDPVPDGGGPVVLRETTWQDIPELARLDRELFGRDAWAEPTWWAELAARPRRYYLTLAGTPAPAVEILGYAGLDLGGDVADVMTVAVAPAARGAGHGTRLLEALVQVALADGAAHLMLEVRADNAPARALYERLDFGVVSVRRRYYGEVDALVMRRPLLPASAVSPASAAAIQEERS